MIFESVDFICLFVCYQHETGVWSEMNPEGFPLLWENEK